MDSLVLFDKMQNEIDNISNKLQLKLIKGEISWEDIDIQLFLPVVLEYIRFDWLEIIAKNTLIKEDETIVINFLKKCESIRDINQHELRSTAIETMRKRGKL